MSIKQRIRALIASAKVARNQPHIDPETRKLIDINIERMKKELKNA